MLMQPCVVARKELIDHARDVRSVALSALYALMGPAVMLLAFFQRGPVDASSPLTKVLPMMAAVFALMAAFTGSMAAAMDTVAGERERRSLVPLGNAKPVKLPISLVPFATTVWDFINRAMPQSRPGSLAPSEVYALTAYVLYRNDVIKEEDVLDQMSLPKVRMPNRDNFLPARLEWKARTKRPFGYYP